jgi:hypothetical protein
VVSVGAGTVTLHGPDGASGATGRESTLCIARGTDAVAFTIAVAVPDGVAADLDLYERPDVACGRE